MRAEAILILIPPSHAEPTDRSPPCPVAHLPTAYRKGFSHQYSAARGTNALRCSVCRYALFCTMVKYATATKQVDQIVQHLKHIPLWLEQWKADTAQQRFATSATSAPGLGHICAGTRPHLRRGCAGSFICVCTSCWRRRSRRRRTHT